MDVVSSLCQYDPQPSNRQEKEHSFSTQKCNQGTVADLIRSMVKLDSKTTPMCLQSCLHALTFLHCTCGAMATLTELTVRQVGQVAPPLKQRLAGKGEGAHSTKNVGIIQGISTLSLRRDGSSFLYHLDIIFISS